MFLKISIPASSLVGVRVWAGQTSTPSRMQQPVLSWRWVSEVQTSPSSRLFSFYNCGAESVELDFAFFLHFYGKIHPIAGCSYCTSRGRPPLLRSRFSPRKIYDRIVIIILHYITLHYLYLYSYYYLVVLFILLYIILCFQ